MNDASENSFWMRWRMPLLVIKEYKPNTKEHLGH